ncbi:MAG TPA: NAD(P)-dependent oxidoreductase [Geminicoccaceae bacterium]|nr:NAD(P)-dependent oxidoreductase [Geminicoccus sp.]HMU49579.1 NAD(P)-dependent oxidoreductase [Geminicoccaceae bacterium]
MAGANATVGLVGLGLVGQALAGRLLAAGADVVGCDPVPRAREAAARLGVRIVDRPGDVARDAALVVLCLPASPQVAEVLWGEGGLAAALSGHVVLDTTTADPAETVANGERLAALGCRFVDCALVGSSAEIGKGEALGLLGTDDRDAAFVPLLEEVIGRLFFLGGCGQGHRAKLVVNLVIGLNRLVLAEGLGLARSCGMDVAVMLEILRSGSAASTVMHSKGPAMLARRYEPPVARLAQHAKDVALILDLAREVGARVPLSRLHGEMLAEAQEQGLGSLDNAAVAELFVRGGA